MKKNILTLVLLFSIFVISPIRAQVKLGVKAGFNLNEIILNKQVFNTTNRVGMFVGPTIKVDFPLTGFGIDLSALYDRKEAQFEILNMPEKTDVTNKQKVITKQQIVVPLNVKYIIGLGSTANIFVFAGPQIAFNIGNQTEPLFEIVNSTTNKTSKQAAELAFQQSNFSINAGVGLTLASHFQLTANYNMAVGKTADVTVQTLQKSIENYTTKAKGWQVGFTYFF